MIMRLPTTLLAVLILPGAAHAGTGSATGTATMTVTSQCSVTGATVSLGTYSTSQTVGDIAVTLGYLDGPGGETFHRGTTPDGALNLGSVTCDANTPYLFAIYGTDYSVGDVFSFDLGSKKLSASVWGQKLGDQVLAPNWFASTRWLGQKTASTGTGAPQQILGNIYLELSYGDIALSDPVGPAGTYSAPLFYTLIF